MDIEAITTSACFAAFSEQTGNYAGASTATGIPTIFDRDFELYEDDQALPRRATTIVVRVSDVPTSQSGDTIIRNGKTWTVEQVLTDDGYERRLEVY